MTESCRKSGGIGVIMGYRDITFEKDSVFLIGGGAGFIGSNLCEALVEMGYTVRCLDNLSTGKYENIAPLIDFY